MEVKEINGQKYSRTIFDGYQLRLIVALNTSQGSVSITIYTTETDKKQVYTTLHSIVTDKVSSINVTLCETKEEDDRMSEFIDELLLEN